MVLDIEGPAKAEDAIAQSTAAIFKVIVKGRRLIAVK
jgi:hypothetical protein